MRWKLVCRFLIGVFAANNASAQTVAAPAPPPNPTFRISIFSNGARVEILLRPDQAPKSVERINPPGARFMTLTFLA